METIKKCKCGKNESDCNCMKNEGNNENKKRQGCACGHCNCGK